ncbi:NGG1p interacting factor NIF3 [Salinicola halimionae]|uniref:NGG1p interacting factor NIF3 n=1 Tax=Salinicola halimionae TaxID=1949081 RepID=UPI000DA1F7C0|nr:NGG1p interacting factor NIF3 [Salinicola halimionae]
MYKLAFFIPQSHLESVKAAVFASGAGRLGDYEACCFQTLGQGQYRALPGAQPHIGAIGTLEYVEEYRVELVCEDHTIRAAIAALVDAHPYEEPAYDAWPLSDLDSLPPGLKREATG